LNGLTIRQRSCQRGGKWWSARNFRGGPAFIVGADLQEDWLAHGKKIFPVLRKKFPQAYFNGLVALSRVIRWEDVNVETERGLSPDEIMDRLEERVGPKGRRLFENFLRKVNKLQAEQHLEARSQIEGGESPPGSSSK
jgi:hypothetical protein